MTDRTHSPALFYKNAIDLSEKEINGLLRKQKQMPFKWITEKLCRGTIYNALYFQKREDDLPTKTNYVKCSKCPNIYTKSGGHLNRHRDSHASGNVLRPSLVNQLIEHSDLSQTVTKDFDEGEKKRIAECCAGLCVDGLLPLNFIDKPSTQKCFTELINLGAERKIMIPKEARFPTRFTVKNYSMKLAEHRQEVFASKLDDIFKLTNGSIAVDYGERFEDYLCVVLHAVQEKDNSAFLSEYLIGFEAAAGSKDADIVWKNIIESVGSLGITEQMLRKMVGISDEGTNIVKTLNEKLDSSIRCVSHVLNTIAKRTTLLYKHPHQNSAYSFNSDEKKLIEDSATLISDIHKFVNIVNRKKNVVEIVGKKLQTHVETRCLSNLNCLRDFESKLEILYNSQFTEQPFLDASDQLLFEQIYVNRRTLNILIQIFSMFENPVVALQASNKPTLHRVWPMVLDIQTKLELLSENSNETGKALAKSALASLERKLEKGFLTTLHKIATVLNPSTRKLNGVPTTEKHRVYTEIRKMLDLPSEHLIHQPQSLMDAADEEADALTSYLSGTYQDITSPDFNVLDFWLGRRKSQLFKIAMKVLSIPATSCSPERGFSVVKRLVTNERSSMNTETVTKIMIGKSLKELADG